jgi:hypothetical protein
MDNVAGHSGPPHDRPMEARVAVLEEKATTMQEAVADLRLATIMAKGFHWF